MIPPQYRAAVAGIALLIAGLAGAAGGAWLAARHFEPQLAAANLKLGEFQNAYLTLAEATGRQNAAIEQLHADGERRKKAALAAAETSHHAAQSHYRKAEAILGLKPPPGVDPCRAARAAFDDELREERGK